MKRIIFLLAFIPVCVHAQDQNDNRYEHALYEILQLNRSAYTTIAYAQDVAFSEREFDTISDAIQVKEELFKVELIDESRALKFFHFDSIGPEEIKEFVLPYKEKIEIAEPLPFHP